MNDIQKQLVVLGFAVPLILVASILAGALIMLFYDYLKEKLRIARHKKEREIVMCLDKKKLVAEVIKEWLN